MTAPTIPAPRGLAAFRSPDTPANAEWKAADQTGVITAEDDGRVLAIVSVTGIADAVDDIIVPGCYKRTLSTRTPKGVWSHDWHVWTSKATAITELMPGDARLPKTTKDGRPWPPEAGVLLVDVQFNLGSTHGRDAFSNVKFFGGDCEWSIGYQVPPGKSRRDAQGRRVIFDIDLFEFCPVLWGAMPLAGTLGRKAMEAVMEHTSGAGLTNPVMDPALAMRVKALLGDEAPIEVKVALGEDTDEEDPDWVRDGMPLVDVKAWVEDGEFKVAGREATPKDVSNTQRLMEYWAHGKGALKIRWGSDGDFDRCVRNLGKYVPPNVVKGLCSNLHVRATGGRPGHAPAEVAERAAKPGKKETPVEPEVKADATMNHGDHTHTIKGADDVKKAVACLRKKGDDTSPLWRARLHAAAKKAGADDALPDSMKPSSKGLFLDADGKGFLLDEDGTLVAEGEVKSTDYDPGEEGGPDAGWSGFDQANLGLKDFPYLPGSVEERQAEIREALDDILQPPPRPDGGRGGYVSLDATFADHVIATVTDFGSADSESQSFQVPYTIDEDGQVTLGTPEPVDKVLQVVPDTDYGQDGDGDGDVDDGLANAVVPMAQNVGVLAKALVRAVEVKAPGALDPSNITRLRQAHSYLLDVVASLGDMPDEPPDGDGEKALPHDDEMDLLLLRSRALLL